MFSDAHRALSARRLDDHVNNFGQARHNSPYISLTAGVVTWRAHRRVVTHGAWATAANFATGGGQVPGYIFECWLLVGPKPVPELPGFGEEVRDLNASAHFSIWHPEGEIAAKLVVPPRQIRRVIKINQNGSRAALNGNGWTNGQFDNNSFVPPERITNLRDLVP